MKTALLFVMMFVLAFSLVNGATLTCQQITDSSIELPQFSSTSVEIQCTASGGTISNIQITPNPNPGSGLSITTSNVIPSSLSDQQTGTAKWTLTGETPNTYSISYTVVSDGTETWDGASTTTVVVTATAKLEIEYVYPPATYSEGESLNVKITNIGGTTASNIKLQLNDDPKVNYPSTIEAGAQASYSWTSDNGFDSAGEYTTKAFIGEVLQDSATTTVGSGSTTSTTTTVATSSTTTTTSGGGGGSGGAGYVPVVSNSFTMSQKEEMFTMKKGDSVLFSVKGSNHTTQVTGIYPEKVLLTITSEPINVSITKGTSKRIDIDNDGSYELAISVERIANESGELVADIDFKLINETVIKTTEKKEEVRERTTTTSVVVKHPGKLVQKHEVGQPPVARSNWIIPLVLIFVGVAVVVLIVVKIWMTHRKP